MRNLLALLAAVVLVVAGIGWYRGWFHVQARPGSDGHEQISIDVDRKKIAADVKKGVAEGTHEIQNLIKKDGHTTVMPGQAPPPGPVSGVTNSFRFNPDGSIEYTGEVSVPVPVKQ
jgi:hypothetical protein